MTKIIILEGISTSGKSLLQNFLKNYFEKNGKKVASVDEKEGLNALLDKQNRSLTKSLGVLKSLILNYTSQNYDYIIFDRFHISHNGTLKDSNFEDFDEIEYLLKKFDSKIIYLHVDNSKIIQRIRTVLETTRKNSSFEEFFRSRIIPGCNTLEEENQKIFSFYSLRADQHIKDINKTKLPCLKIDVSDIIKKEEYTNIFIQALDFLEN